MMRNDRSRLASPLADLKKPDTLAGFAAQIVDGCHTQARRNHAGAAGHPRFEQHHRHAKAIAGGDEWRVFECA
ncbi:MAG: hypothetical protein ACREQD_13910 [Candidatus Binataceae bacterium]